MSQNINNDSGENKRSRYERLWWIILACLLFLCGMAIITGVIPHLHNSIYQVFLQTMFITSMILLIYSLAFIVKLPKGMVTLGVVQGVIFGYHITAAILKL